MPFTPGHSYDVLNYIIGGPAALCLILHRFDLTRTPQWFVIALRIWGWLLLMWSLTGLVYDECYRAYYYSHPELLRSLYKAHYNLGGAGLGLLIFLAFSWREKRKFERLAKAGSGGQRSSGVEQS